MLELKAVCYRYKNTTQDVLKEVSARFEPGKFQSIVGASGSGKSTLLSIMAGMDTPTGGQVLIENQDLATINLDQYRRERIAMIFQAFHLFPLLTVLENAAYVLEISGTPKAKAHETAAELLVKVGIATEKHKRFPAQLSGGEQQRVAIARALSTGAKTILADEPTGNLDVANSEAVIEILQSLAHVEGYCVIVVTHNLEIAALSDRVYRMSDGVLTASLQGSETFV